MAIIYSQKFSMSRLMEDILAVLMVEKKVAVWAFLKVEKKAEQLAVLTAAVYL